MLRIHALVFFLSVKSWFQGLFFLNGIYITCFYVKSIVQMLPMGIHIDVKLTLTSNISYLIRGDMRDYFLML